MSSTSVMFDKRPTVRVSNAEWLKSAISSGGGGGVHFELFLGSVSST